MTNDKNPGNNPAFPGKDGAGITKRELMAAIVCSGLLANPEVNTGETDTKHMAAQAVAATDDLLRQLSLMDVAAEHEAHD